MEARNYSRQYIRLTKNENAVATSQEKEKKQIWEPDVVVFFSLQTI